MAWIFDGDVLLSKLPAPERERFWEAAFDFLPHRARAVLLALPLLEGPPFGFSDAQTHGANEEIMPSHPLGPSRSHLARWRQAGRLEWVTTARRPNV